MTKETYTSQAIRTESVPEAINIAPIVLINLLCVMRSVGNQMDAFKKKVFYDKPIDAMAYRASFEDGQFRSGVLNDIVENSLEQDTDKFIEFCRAGLVSAKAEEGDEYGPTFEEFNQRMDTVRAESLIHAANADKFIRHLHVVLGIFTEAGELAEAMLKAVMEGKMDAVNFAEELGDVDWYKAIGHDVTGIDEETMRAKNIAKLRKRFPEKFTSENAINRDVAAEREILEG